MGLCVNFADTLSDLDVVRNEVKSQSHFISSFFPNVTKNPENNSEYNEIESLLYKSCADKAHPDWAISVARDSLWVYHYDYRRWAYTFEFCKKVVLDFVKFFPKRDVVSIFVGYHDIFNINISKFLETKDIKIPGVIFKKSKYTPPIFLEKSLSSFTTSFYNDLYSIDDFKIAENVSIESFTQNQDIDDDDKLKFSVSIDSQVHAFFHHEQPKFDFLMNNGDSFDQIAQKSHETSKSLFCSIVDDPWLKAVGINPEESGHAIQNVD